MLVVELGVLELLSFVQAVFIPFVGLCSLESKMGLRTGYGGGLFDSDFTSN